jgi:hypothetical protein
MTNFYAIKGQTLTDICLNTYGTLDYYYKLLTDNNVPNANYIPTSNELFVYDETLVFDNAINRTTTINNIKYATDLSENGNVFYQIV